MTAAKIEWLRVLVETFAAEHDWDADCDPAATSEMVTESRAAVAELKRLLPACCGCGQTVPQGADLCPSCEELAWSTEDEARLPY